ncbi:ABC transporter ATP-binding protein [Bengtsoniella intestinalis]|uniref:ABC transporter ATP-binding protein n=1 Tax=Bengtsoniella intestinalis TaxID=3073143 RepID=UPI00391F8DC7
MATFLTFDHVSKRFGQESVLQDVSFTLEQGQIYGIVGRNGSGKTVIFKLIAGLLRPDKGEIFCQGQPISRTNAFLPWAGILIESPCFLPHYSGLKNLQVLNSLSPHPVPKARLQEVMTQLGLDPKSRKAVRSYSLGMKQKLGIAQAIMHHPSLLILDEPMNGLDESSVAQVRTLLQGYKEKGTTIFLSSHNPEDIHALCDGLFTVKAGQVTVQKVVTPMADVVAP